MAGRLALLFFGVFACSTAVIFIRLSAVDAVLLAGYRCLVAAAFLSPLFLRDLRRHRARYSRRHLLRALAPGALLGAHFISWIYAARMTPAANCTLIVNMVPLVMPFFLFALVRERPTRGELAGSAVALAGVVVMAASDLGFDARHFRGDALSLGSMLFLCVYLVLGRRNRDFPSVWLYLVPVYAISGGIALAAGSAVSPAWGPFTPSEVALVLALGLVPTVVGHSTLNYSMRHLGAQAVGVSGLGQAFFAGVMAYLLLGGETPRWTTYVAAGLIACGMVVALRSAARAEAAAVAEPSTAAQPEPVQDRPRC
ncbi:MAG: DMT family transporter [Planctomycetota bacterium]|jgi:drug/metabolite transporter (DMT)-like permease